MDGIARYTALNKYFLNARFFWTAQNRSRWRSLTPNFGSAKEVTHHIIPWVRNAISPFCGVVWPRCSLRKFVEGSRSVAKQGQGHIYCFSP